MTKSTLQQEAAVRHYLATGDHEPGFLGWPGSNFLDAAQRGSAILCDALLAEVASRTRLQGIASGPVNPDVTALARSKISPMVAGLFTVAEQPMVLAMLERSVVFLHPGNIESVLRSARWSHTAWSLANLYLVSVGCERLSDEAPNIVGLSEETTCYVSPAYFSSQNGFADYIVHEAAHVFHNCKRATVGLKETRRRDFLLDIDYEKRETFAYACEAYSCMVARDGNAAGRRAALAAHADSSLPGDDSVDLDEYLDILREAVEARNGWKRILQRCAPRESRAAPRPIPG
ncbi:MAG: hypothetical protein M3Y55_11140 [Pseudomonadota bacterium]|nr:hypothetical protein [Pseudomonadota bacterium]